MAKPVPPEVDAEGFDANLEECSAPLKEMVAYLRSTARHAGTMVSQRRYRHPKPNTGWGISHYSGGNRFCEFHPKREVGHVWGFIQGADPALLVADGFAPSEQDGWFKIRTMPEAVRFVKWILWAHDRRG
jgi:hypothetical protein